MMNVSYKASLAACIAAVTLGWAATASADSATGSLTVQVNLVDDCKVSSSDGNSPFGGAFLNFGTQGTLTDVVDGRTEASGNGALLVQCTKGVAYSVGLGAGTNPGTPGDVNTRRMGNAGEYVTYQLYSDSGRATVWGDQVGQNTVQRTSTGQVEAIPVYGRIPPQTTPRRGLYTDIVSIILTY